MRTATDKHPVDIHVGRGICQRRIALGMSQQAVAAVIGTTFQQVQKYERGQNRVSASRLWEIARALEVEPGHFYEGLTHGSEPTEPNVQPDRSSLMLARYFKKITRPEVKAKLLGLMRILAGAEEEPESGALGYEGRLQA